MLRIKKIKPTKKSDTLSVTVSGYKIYISKDSAKESNLAIGMELPKKYHHLLNDTERIPNLKKKVHNFISFKPRTEFQIKQYLAKEGADEHTIEEILVFLYEFNLLDDKKYAKSFIADLYLKKPMGRNIAIRELIERGLPKEIAENAAMEITDSQEYENLEKLVEKKTNSKITKSLYERQKLTRYLLSRGFNISMINKWFENYHQDKDN